MRAVLALCFGLLGVRSGAAQDRWQLTLNSGKTVWDLRLVKLAGDTQTLASLRRELRPRLADRRNVLVRMSRVDVGNDLLAGAAPAADERRERGLTHAVSPGAA